MTHEELLQVLVGKVYAQLLEAAGTRTRSDGKADNADTIVQLNSTCSDASGFHKINT